MWSLVLVCSSDMKVLISGIALLTNDNWWLSPRDFIDDYSCDVQI